MIRPAKPEDSREVSQLVAIILRDMELPLVEKLTEEQLLDVIEQAFLSEDTRFSQSYITVQEIEGRVAGIAVVYPGRDADRIDRNLSELITRIYPEERIVFEKEAEEDELYLDALCVFPEYRGQGVGTALLEATMSRSAEPGWSKLSLNVELFNQQARKLYERMGFVAEKDIRFAGHDYCHMFYKLS
ncbi:GNAT family N-acetyltransferase [Paenibacillus filicis]|uniref:GNAT family N-acetyltransferase n=1 Tax=Paenibacillus filicis TaxID=669464 RepID=A0ABU9DJZ2_9BACL